MNRTTKLVAAICGGDGGGCDGCKVVVDGDNGPWRRQKSANDRVGGWKKCS